MGSRTRQDLRERLRKAFGDSCYWCGKPMDFVNFGEFDPPTDNTATLEHHIAKEKGDINQILYLRLSHRKCNI